MTWWIEIALELIAKSCLRVGSQVDERVWTILQEELSCREELKRDFENIATTSRQADNPEVDYVKLFEMKAQLGLIVTRQIRLQGITVGHRDGFEAMVSAIKASGMKPVVDQIYSFTSLLEAMNSLSKAKHFGKICLEF